MLILTQAVNWIYDNNNNNATVRQLSAITSVKKAPRGDANTARWLQQGGAKNFHPAADPLPEGVGRPKLNQLEMVTTFTYKTSLVRINGRNFELSW